MIYLDFEFNNVLHEKVNLVCCTTHKIDNDVVETKEWWLFEDISQQKELKKYVEDNQEEIIFGWSTVAEGRSFLSLDLDPYYFNWIDGFLEYRCLSNHSNKLMYGNQLVDGVVKFTKKPASKWERVEGEKQNSFKQTHSLAEATYKLLGTIRDTKEKDEVREIIIRGDREEILKNKIRIMKYCTEDTVYLPNLFRAIMEEYRSRGITDSRTLINEMIVRGEYSALTAEMESIGYPIDYEKTKNFSMAVGPLLEETQREINNLFPNIKPFYYNRKDRKFSMNQKGLREWIANNCNSDSWEKTDTYKRDLKKYKEENGNTDGFNETDYLSLSLEAWTRFFDFKHDYPKDNFGAQMVRYLKLKQNMNGFIPTTKKKCFWDYVGPDKRVRPYFNIYGSQSSRSQPAATGFLFLKPAWMRTLCVPPKGKAIASFDYGSEEFLISALWSKDQNMIDAYKSGDVYLYYAKLVGAIPMDGTKEKYKRERDLFKATVLGMSYLMSKYGLSNDLTQKLGREVTVDEAQERIDEFNNTFSDLAEAQETIIDEYERKIINYLKLECGWYMWGDNDNFRSVANMSIQGMGGSIMRRAVRNCKERGISVVITLHDALYIEYDSWDFSAIDKLKEAMNEAFIYYFTDKKNASLIRLDGYTWSQDYPAPKVIRDEKGKEKMVYEAITTPGGEEIELGNLYIDERGEKEYNQFKKYFDNRGVLKL